MKTIYINEDMMKKLRESVLKDAFPVDIMSAIENNETPFGDNSFFMTRGGSGMSKNFLKKAAKERYKLAVDTLKKIGRMDDVESEDIEGAFNEIISKCQKIEANHKDALEKLACNYVIDLFSIPDETVVLDAKLVNKIEDGDKISPIEPFDGDVNFEVKDISDVSAIDQEVAKRRFLNAINMGAGMRMSEHIRGYIDELYDIDSRLPNLYKEALALNNYIIFKSPDLGITDKERKQIGIVNVVLGTRDELVNIEAKGVIFPILLCELIRGLMELFSSHGMPKDIEKFSYILKKSDFLKAEPWQMRIGPYMWNLFSEYFEDTDTDEMPYIYQVLSNLKPDIFFDVISEMFARTGKGKEYAKKIMNKAREKKERFDFDNKMSKRKLDKTLITDEYMLTEEF